MTDRRAAARESSAPPGLGLEDDLPARPSRRRQARRQALVLGTLAAVLVLVATAGIVLVHSTLSGSSRTPGGPGPANTVRPGERAGAANTGVPAGTELHRHEGNLVVTKAGTVIDRLDVHGTITIEAANVVVQRTRVTSGSFHPIYVKGGRDVVIRDVEVNGQPGCAVGIGMGWYTAERVDVHGCEDGMRAGNDVTISHCFIHDLRLEGGSHNDGIQSTNGSHIVITGNTIVNPDRQTSAILLKADFADISDVQVTGNYLAGGAYTLYALHGKRYDIADVTVSGNVFAGHALYGDVDTSTQLRWAANTDASGRPLATPGLGK